MAFIQLIEYETSKPDDVRRVTKEWEQATEGKRKANRIVVGKHHDEEKRYCEMVFFDSYDEAMENSELPETKEYAEKIKALFDGQPTYFNIDIIEDRQL